MRFDKNDYSVPVKWAHHPVVVKAYAGRVRLQVGGEVVATHDRCYGAGEFILRPEHYVPLLERKPGGSHNARPFRGEPWGEDFARMRQTKFPAEKDLADFDFSAVPTLGTVGAGAFPEGMHKR